MQLVIYAEVKSAPVGWVEYWSAVPVIWDCKNVQSYKADSGEVYVLENGTAKLVKGVNFKNYIVSESIYAFGQNYAVVEIGTYAFYNFDYLETVYIPKTVEKIGYQAFYNYQLVINVEAKSRPIGWDWSWENVFQVNWGVTM